MSCSFRNLGTGWESACAREQIIVEYQSVICEIGEPRWTTDNVFGMPPINLAHDRIQTTIRPEHWSIMRAKSTRLSQIFTGTTRQHWEGDGAPCSSPVPVQDGESR